jgi:hypothetical protein
MDEGGWLIAGKGVGRETEVRGPRSEDEDGSGMGDFLKAFIGFIRLT